MKPETIKTIQRLNDPLVKAFWPAEILDALADTEGEVERLTAANTRYADRCWTCNGCGFSWNCDASGVDDRGFKVCPIACPTCEIDRLTDLIGDAVVELTSVADEMDAPEHHDRSPSSYWRSRAVEIAAELAHKAAERAGEGGKSWRDLDCTSRTKQ